MRLFQPRRGQTDAGAEPDAGKPGFAGEAIPASLELSDVEAIEYPRVSEILGVPAGTVMSRIVRARRLLQDALYEYALEMGYVQPSKQA